MMDDFRMINTMAHASRLLRGQLRETTRQQAGSPGLLSEIHPWFIVRDGAVFEIVHYRHCRPSLTNFPPTVRSSFTWSVVETARVRAGRLWIQLAKCSESYWELPPDVFLGVEGNRDFYVRGFVAEELPHAFTHLHIFKCSLFTFVEYSAVCRW